MKLPYASQVAIAQLTQELDAIDRSYRRLLSESMPDVRRVATFIAWGFDRYRTVRMFNAA